MPVWKGFGPATFRPAVNPETGAPYTYANDGFEATSYTLATDQFGTQFDPPAHWAPEQAAIDEIPASYSRPAARGHQPGAGGQEEPDGLPHGQGGQRPGRSSHGRIPAGSVVFVRSDWSQRWSDNAEDAKYLAAQTDFPSVGLDALKYLHRKRHILFHGHEPLDTDSTPTLEGEAWLMHHGYAQAEGVDNLESVPATGCLVSFGSPKFGGGLGGYARYVAICPPKSTDGGVKIKRSDAPLPKFGTDLHFDADKGYRVR